MKWFCKIRGHRLTVHRNISPDIQELYCERCKRFFAIHHQVKTFLPLDYELKQFNDWMLSD